MVFSIGDIIWSVKKREQAFSFRLSKSDTSSNNELIIGDDDVNAWLNQGKDCYRGWGYRPLACLMSHFLGCPIQLTDIIKAVFTGNTVPAQNLRIVLNYQLETLYRRDEFYFIPNDAPEQLRNLLPASARQSNVGQIIPSSIPKGMRDRIFG